MRHWTVSLGIVLLGVQAHAAEVSVAVASNFTEPIKVIAADFEKATGHGLALSFGSTGKFYAQIRNGAPFEVLLAADDETPGKLESEARIVAGSRFTYAIGKLVLWSAREGFLDSGEAVLREGHYGRLAIASPKVAPYGRAAIETLEKLGLREAVEPKFVTGENIAQTFQFVSSGNAELGFVALSQVYRNGNITSGSAWIVPAALHSPIRQDAVLLAKGAGNPAAAALLEYLKSESVRKVIEAFGYDIGREMQR
ncbi:MAG: molybdate-binding periplasmic protein ModA [Candidatus Hydrogenedentota bacterium]